MWRGMSWKEKAVILNERGWQTYVGQYYSIGEQPGNGPTGRVRWEWCPREKIGRSMMDRGSVLRCMEWNINGKTEWITKREKIRRANPDIMGLIEGRDRIDLEGYHGVEAIPIKK